MAVTDLHDDFLRFEEEQITEEQGEQFRIDDDNKADWACRKIAQAEANIERRKAFVQQEIERLQFWLEQENEKDQRTIDHMTGLLAPYFEHLRESGVLGKKKSYRLPHGTLQVRTQQPRFARNDDELLPYAKQIGLVRAKESPDWSELKKRLGITHEGACVDSETGEVVPGVRVEEPAREVFTVKPEGVEA